jgi:hypothetical protein
MASFVDACKFRAVSSGTGDFVVSAAVQGFQTPAQAGAGNGLVYRYRAENFDLSEWEVGYGAYTSGTLTLARTTVLANHLGTTAAVNFTTRPYVGIVILAMDLQSNANIQQEVTAGASATVADNASVVRVNKTVGSATSLTMPLSTAKTCDVLISDWKMDASTNNITINLSGSEKFPGNLSTWTIAADGGSVFLRRVPGVGYAL